MHLCAFVSMGEERKKGELCMPFSSRLISYNKNKKMQEMLHTETPMSIAPKYRATLPIIFLFFLS